MMEPQIPNVFTQKDEFSILRMHTPILGFQNELCKQKNEAQILLLSNSSLYIVHKKKNSAGDDFYYLWIHLSY